MKQLIILLLPVLFAISCTASNVAPGTSETYTVVLSMDGFRWDYPDSFATPNLDKIAEKGVKASSIIPVFPSVTFPNHYSMATGLYPDHHGIIHNTFYDTALVYTYRIADRKAVENGRFYHGEPIWNTAEKQGIKSAIFYWVGSEANVQGMRPTYWKKYDNKITFEQRVDTVVKWLSLPEIKRPGLIMFYFDEPDHAGHSYGPFSNETESTVMHCDSMVGLLMEKLAKLPVAKKVNLVVTSDHGMGATDNNKKISLHQILNKAWIKGYYGSNPVFLIDPGVGYTDSVLNKLKKQAHIKTWEKSQVPERLYYGKNPNISDIVVVADSGWSVVFDDRPVSKGTHGYDPVNSDMHAIFYAYGPAFKKKYRQPVFQNIHIYPLLAAILGIKPVKTDGDINPVKGMLK